jgi:nucleotide-binding universal stress UspA family protein
MIKTILVCLDGSKYSEAALNGSLWFAKQLKAELHILSIADVRLLEGPWLADLSGMTGAQPFQALAPQMREIYESKAQMVVSRAAEAAKKQDVLCHTEVRTGRLVDEILQAELNVELVVMGQRGEGFEITGEWLGTNVERVVRKSIKPCLVTPGEFRPVQNILIAYDGSEHANHALYAALDLTKALKAKLTILAVEGTNDEEEKSWRLKEASDIAEKQGVKAAPLVVHGSPEEKILEVASDQKIDLIVMGAYGHTRLRELVLGSVTNHVIRKSSVPVLLTR